MKKLILFLFVLVPSHSMLPMEDSLKLPDSIHEDLNKFWDEVEIDSSSGQSLMDIDDNNNASIANSTTRNDDSSASNKPQLARHFSLTDQQECLLRIIIDTCLTKNKLCIVGNCKRTSDKFKQEATTRHHFFRCHLTPFVCEHCRKEVTGESIKNAQTKILKTKCPRSTNSIHNLINNEEQVTKQLNNIIKDAHIETPSNLINNIKNRTSKAFLSPQHLPYWAYIAKHWPIIDDIYICNLKHIIQSRSIRTIQALKNHAFRCHIAAYMCNNCHVLIYGADNKVVQERSDYPCPSSSDGKHNLVQSHLNYMFYKVAKDMKIPIENELQTIESTLYNELLRRMRNNQELEFYDILGPNYESATIGPKNSTLLHIAAFAGTASCLSNLLSTLNITDFNILDADGQTPLNILDSRLKECSDEDLKQHLNNCRQYLIDRHALNSSELPHNTDNRETDASDSPSAMIIDDRGETQRPVTVDLFPPLESTNITTEPPAALPNQPQKKSTKKRKRSSSKSN